ncbi:MAG: mechanosensitive ion channel domain-containing protein [Desulfocapsaceae bacterium]|jgi:small-conductance mechanosensitive channel|nr:mechanosensitive ion channel domain-containing protein [Desulfocapsaceae bacterium]
MLESLISFAPFAGIVAALIGILWAAQWLLISRYPDFGNERKFPRQLIMLGLTLFGLLVSILVLPVSESSRNQLIGLIGIVISGVLAFSSTTIISNLMAGVLLRMTKPFKLGDFIRIGEHFGRVSERGLFDTEIQTETRELIALPNTYCINNPVTTIRSSGTIISASLSLGYDVDHTQVESLLLEASRTCGLEEPFVHIMELGNFSVTYRVSGFLEESKRLISVRSSLYGCVLDTLHSKGIEIMSPSFMTQRQLRDGEKLIPSVPVVAVSESPASSAEKLAFDKAERAEEIENEKQLLKDEIERLEQTVKQGPDGTDTKALQDTLDRKRERLKAIETVVDELEISRNDIPEAGS